MRSSSLNNLVDDGRLLRTWRDGSAKIFGYLEDYAFLVDGLISLYEATFDRRWLDEARFFGDRIPELFRDDGDEALYDTGSDHDPVDRQAERPVRQCGPVRKLRGGDGAAEIGFAHWGFEISRGLRYPRLRSVADSNAASSERLCVVAMRPGLPSCPSAGSGGHGRAGRS